MIYHSIQINGYIASSKRSPENFNFEISLMIDLHVLLSNSKDISKKKKKKDSTDCFIFFFKFRLNVKILHAMF